MNVSTRLYTYLLKDNTALTEGLLSTALSDKGFEKYRGRTGKYKKEDVLKVMDSWEPEWKRSKALSVLTQPIPDDATEDLVEFAKNHELYSFDVKDLIKVKILAHLRLARKGGGTDPVESVKPIRANWHRKKRKHLLFKGIPHYFVETKDGKIPPELIRQEKRAGASKARQLVTWYMKRRKAIADALRDARANNPYVRGPGTSLFTRSSPVEKLDRKLRYELATDLKDKLDRVFQSETIGRFRAPKRSPRMALFRGSHRLSATGPGYNPATGYGHIETAHVPGSQYSHATGDIDVAAKGTYGKLLEVYNAKRVPGAVSGKLKWFGDTGAQAVANEDFTAVKGLYSKTKNDAVRRMLLDGESPGYETLIQTSKIRPDRLYLVRRTEKPFKRKYTDITALKDMYFNARDKVQQRAIGQLIDTLG